MRPTSLIVPRHFGLLYVAGYLAWGAVAVDLWRRAAVWPPVGSLSARQVTAALLACFLAGFVARGAPVRGRTVPLAGSVSLAAMIAACFSLMWLGPPDSTAVLLIIIAVVLAGGYSARTVWALLASINAAFLAVLLWRWHVADPWTLLLIYGSFQIFAAVTAGARRDAERAADELREVNARLLATRALLAESARDGERLRVSRELHDVTGHKLTALTLNLEALALAPAVGASRELAISRALSAELLADIRSVVSRLRRDDGIDLGEALRRLAEAFPRPSIHLDIGNDVRVDGAARAEALVRACQEGLTNAVRHAAASNIWLTLARQPGAVELVVEDDGDFSGSYAAGHGLTGMRERVAEVGGTVDTERGATGGFRLVVRVPEDRGP